MDETKTRWFRWVADHAEYLFWGVWGAGAGAFGTVFFKAVDAGSDVLRVYLAIVTAMMAGVLGLLTARGMDSHSDRRRVRREMYAMLLRVNEVRDDLTWFTTCLSTISENGTKSFTETELTYEQIVDVIVDATALKTSAANKPDFDELMDTEQDLDHAHLVTEFLNFLELHLNMPEEDASPADERRWATIVVNAYKPDGAYKEGLESLDKAQAHFQRKARNI